MKPTFEKFRAAVLRGVNMVGQALQNPDDDWIPCMHLFGPYGYQILAMPWDNEEGQREALKLIPQLFREKRPRLAAFIVSVWERVVPMDAPNFHETMARLVREGVATDDKRTEAVRVMVSDGTREEVWSAPITRHQNRGPELGGWEDRTGLVRGGKLDLVLHDGFRAVRTGGGMT